MRLSAKLKMNPDFNAGADLMWYKPDYAFPHIRQQFDGSASIKNAALEHRYAANILVKKDLASNCGDD